MFIKKVLFLEILEEGEIEDSEELNNNKKIEDDDDESSKINIRRKMNYMQPYCVFLNKV